ncbi:hypothetical protein A3C91_00065 [Candidatus Azambacteria bacterium RIFCSPHIGHO2_02_FULL_52_12]|uniref:Uncharacterized protein n=1 Tax=Candidatus Azambacteria bacterium RIFCSPLOWO2_01_FULL_46_25 TaxID=1797298 RepID=A0A1F5BUN2_9BACT|nr:MAG: hypothetical protein A3C91_00065 [Candidatus Azambacteria bacterium RIFCSPHIGHO2_02_FULL_52_12]OGD34335.1 MAG: hypothetical protein A2988_02295 [Candidatus Azambacteria bacterium RIFCSPLOWO2_01_FULL_46_25]OGD37387.1 MAG: hypothetical protein A2850_01590 [Candidatus Azambacteria bacterium RIFCSPHIGHO2_01_FULL_51_74]
MAVKMIVAKINNQPKIVFGDRHYSDDYHSDIAERMGIPKSAVLGGGIADVASRRIYGTSYGFGPYNPTLVRGLLPDWTVERPSNY